MTEISTHSFYSAIVVHRRLDQHVITSGSKHTFLNRKLSVMHFCSFPINSRTWFNFGNICIPCPASRRCNFHTDTYFKTASKIRNCPDLDLRSLSLAMSSFIGGMFTTRYNDKKYQKFLQFLPRSVSRSMSFHIER